MKTKKKKIVILGSTGSIGKNALKVALEHQDLINVVGLVARNNVDLLAAQAAESKCETIITSDTSKESQLKSLAPANCNVLSGEKAIRELVSRQDVDLVLCAIIGTSGLLPVIDALQLGKTVALASKEVLVTAGELVLAAAKKGGGKLIPVDSEHSAIFQCLEGHKKAEVKKIILTASGGAFRDSSQAEIDKATYEEALAHPTWDMGAKVTVDSATMMNKALEIIEAGYLFNLAPEQIEVVIHREAIIHSMVEFVDACILAQMSEPDMCFPIQYAMLYPERRANSMKALDFGKCKTLSFSLPDRKKFPSLDFAYEALRQGGTMPAVLNAANEVAVERFRKGEIAFPQIWTIIDKLMKLHKVEKQKDVKKILQADAWARETAKNINVK